MKDRILIRLMPLLFVALLASCRSHESSNSVSKPKPPVAPAAAQPPADPPPTPPGTPDPGPDPAPAAARQAAAPAPAAGPSGYDLSCDASDATNIKGYVANRGSDTYQVTGIVVFSFTGGPSPRSPMQANADAMIPAHQTVLASQAQPSFKLGSGEKCQFDPGPAIKKVNP